MNILVIAEKNWLTKNVFELQAFPEALANLGHQVMAIDYNETWTWQGISNVWKEREVRKRVKRTPTGKGVTLYRPRQVLIPMLSRFTSACDFFKLLREVIQKHDVDVILLYAVPTYGIQTLFLARKYQIPVVFRSIDRLPNLVPRRVLKYPTRCLERIVYSKVDSIIAHTPNLADYVVSAGADSRKVHLLLPPVDLNVFSPSNPDKELMEKWGVSPRDKVILFVGRLFEFCGVNIIIDQFADQFRGFPEYKLMIVGKGEILNDCERTVEEFDLQERVIFTGYQPFKLIPDFINLSTICIVPFEINEVTNNALPGKIAEYLACGKPVVSTPLRGTLRVYPEKGAGIVFSDLENFMKRVSDLIADPQLCNGLGEEGRQFIRDNFARDKVVEKMDTFLTRITNK